MISSHNNFTPMDFVGVSLWIYVVWKIGSWRKPVAGSFKAARAAKNLRKVIFTIPLRMATQLQLETPKYCKACCRKLGVQNKVFTVCGSWGYQEAAIQDILLHLYEEFSAYILQTGMYIQVHAAPSWPPQWYGSISTTTSSTIPSYYY